MRFHLSCCIVFGIFFTAQVNSVGSKKLHEDQLLALQLKVEDLIQKIIHFIQDFYRDMNNELKCIPDCVSEGLMETLKDSITCVEENEMDYNNGIIRASEHSKNFLGCFKNAKKEIRDMMESVDTTINYCPDNQTEKTYQINVTTTFSKTFRINIKNGLETTKKEIQLNQGTKRRFNGETDCKEDNTEVDKMRSGESPKVGNDKKHTDAVVGGKGQKPETDGKGQQDEAHPRKGVSQSRKDKKSIHESDNSDSTENVNREGNNDSSSTEENNSKDSSFTEKSTKKTKEDNKQRKHLKNETRKSKKPNNDSDHSDYDDNYNSELSSSSTEEVSYDSSDDTLYHHHQNYFRRYRDQSGSEENKKTGEQNPAVGSEIPLNNTQQL